MAANPQHQRLRLSIEVEPELRRQIETAAADRDVSVHDYIISILKRAVVEDESDEAVGWARLSARSFARDWESEADQVYDHLS
jgi:hypothetical protein